MKSMKTAPVAATLLAAALAAAPARAELVLSLGASHAPPGYGGEFDVLLTDPSTDPASYNVSGFGYELTTDPNQVYGGDPGLTFTGGDTNSPAADGNSYIFGTYQGAPGSFVSSNSGTDLIAGDQDSTDPYYVTLAPGQTVSLGEISYVVDPAVPYGTSLNVNFADVYDATTNPTGQTDVTDVNGNALPFTTANGEVSATPEPSQAGVLALAACGLGGLLLRARRRSPA